jgi:eukaryotic-like serine/threonine-protein kinase
VCLLLIMPHLSHSPDLATRHWDEMAQRIADFLSAWEERVAPALAAHLPPEPGAMRQLTLIELIKADLEQRLRRGLVRRIEDYVAEFPELLSGSEPPVDLIYEEFHIRRSAGQEVHVSEYFERFPGCRAGLLKLLGDGLAVSSAMFAAFQTDRHTSSGRLANAVADKQPTRWLGQFAVGDQVDDFDLLSELGRGAFGQVFLARQRSMHRLVALKVSAERSDEPQMLATLDHPHIVRVYDQKGLAGQRLRLLYMQYVPGGTLADVISHVRKTPPSARSGALLLAAVDAAMLKAGQVVDEDASWRRRVAAATWVQTVCRTGMQLARALDHAHRQGVLHRDVKPANVLLSADGSPKLADFNISFGSHVAGATPAAYFGGSLAYMSPEQLEACDPRHPRKADELDGRSDIFSLAVLLWELLYGFRPFADGQLESGWDDTLQRMATRRREGQIEIPPDVLDADPAAKRLQHVLRKALSYDRDLRQPSGAVLARELMLCLHGASWEIFHNFGGGLWKLAGRRPLATLVAVNLIPHVFAGAYNYFFNQATIMGDNSGTPDVVKAYFDTVAIIVNGIAFPLGVILGVACAWQLMTTLLRTRRGEKCPPEQLTWARRRALSIGWIIAAIGVGEWLVAGIVFPMLLHLLAGSFSPRGYLHFFLSLAACGLIAAAFPYLGTTRLALRVIYPGLLANSTPDDPAEQRELHAIPQQAGWYLFLAAIVPLVAVGLVIVTVDEGRFWSALLIVAGVAALVAAYFTYRGITSDVEALTIAARPVETLGEFGTSSESFEG